MGRRGVSRAAVGVAAAVALSGCSGQSPGPSSSSTSSSTTSPTSSSASSPASLPASSPASLPASSPKTPGPRVLLTGLDVPWDVAFLPDRSALLTLRDKAEVLHLRADGRSRTSLGIVPGVLPDGEGGLLGVAPSPAYATDHTVFLYFTAATDNRIVRAVVSGDRLGSYAVIFSGIAKAGFHNGGRIAFGPDGFLYVGTGDAGEQPRAQDTSSVNGKILRLTKDGHPAPGNPFGNAVWSYGHRNVQGLAWAPDGTMYASEFGQNTWDELNRIQPGKNYGWPVVEGRAGRDGFVDPVAQWATSEASPSGIAYAAGWVWMAGLRGESLWQVPVASGGAPVRHLKGTYGRLRDVSLAPDGTLWLLTSNTFRGTPGDDDDRLVSVPLP